MRDDLARLRDVIEAIGKIEKYAVRGKAAFEGDELIQNWIVHHIQIIGEACGRVSEPFRAEHPDIQWDAIRGMRNILVHRYFEIDNNLVWNVVEKDLPALKDHVVAILTRADGPAD